ncbi:MAG: tRNA uridine(34) 5-carboxymethylaminomethyl modification radical SAM/GNAT enzyme Elp3 [Candidatus Pacebacteria bacterium]|nr:tRNA uridine(34) 5-carboxymethylaminomethyl modification radical SAM/GNAT enzyme Elp3 [Candidatus Paceibacterota bacterium]
MNLEEKIINKLIKTKNPNPKILEGIIRSFLKTSKEPFPKKSELLKSYHKINKKGILNEKQDELIKILLTTRPVRSLSGIVNVSVLTKPYPCPGQCVYCPSEEGMPKSYLKSEPAAMRAAMNNFDPTKQVKVRLRALEMTGHPTDKIEIRIIGGTWSSYNKNYQTNFIKKCFDACNPSDSKNLIESQKKNEKSKHRIVGLSVETRPDFINQKEVERLRCLGVTSIELGVQATDDQILKKTKRGHNISATIKATKLLKDAGFKICYQMMPNLPGSSIQRDRQMFEELFTSPDFQPDYLKIYPTSTIKGTELYNMFLRKEYTPYTEKELKALLKDIKKSIPYYVRIQRLIRDIPSQEIEVGSKISNLRDIIHKEAIKEGWSCKCIRCREIKGLYNSSANLKLFKQEYLASEGKEFFLSIEDTTRKNIYSLLRLRFTSRNTAIIREVHTYGLQTSISKKAKSPQHKGLGKKLIKEAEAISKENGFKEIWVISAVGTRPYYRKLGYRVKKTYMVKKLS